MRTVGHVIRWVIGGRPDVHVTDFDDVLRDGESRVLIIAGPPLAEGDGIAGPVEDVAIGNRGLRLYQILDPLGILFPPAFPCHCRLDPVTECDNNCSWALMPHQ